MKTKPLLLTAFVIVTFVLYSLQQRNESSINVVVPSSKTAASQSAPSTSIYNDGNYTGTVADAFYGDIQVQATVSGGKITDVKFLRYPNDQVNSILINQQAMPFLRQEAIKAQSAHVDIISGATDTSYAFIQSLGAALQQAQA